MNDRMSEEDRSYTMSQIQSTGTEPEERLAALLKELLPEDEPVIEHAENLPGTPDFYLPEREVALFADGCFFHKCPEHFQMPKSNQDYWKSKLERNVERDAEVDEQLSEQGIATVRIWEHALKDNLQVAREQINGVINDKSE